MAKGHWQGAIAAFKDALAVYEPSGMDYHIAKTRRALAKAEAALVGVGGLVQSELRQCFEAA